MEEIVKCKCLFLSPTTDIPCFENHNTLPDIGLGRAVHVGEDLDSLSELMEDSSWLFISFTMGWVVSYEFSVPSLNDLPALKITPSCYPVVDEKGIG